VGRWIWVLFCLTIPDFVRGDEPAEPANIAQERLAIMRGRAEAIVFSSTEPSFPARLEPAPLFRYEDQTRGYVDGVVWRLGERGRPLAIITTELHPNYLGTGPRVVYDFLSLSERRFQARSADVPGWSPRGSAVEMRKLLKAPAPANTAAGRLSQIKEQSRRFTATQEVAEQETVLVHLRLLPREIDRYTPDSQVSSDGAMFLFVNGRNPGLALLLETRGDGWQWGVGRLSAPSTLTLRLDDVAVWTEPPATLTWDRPYTASNSAAKFP